MRIHKVLSGRSLGESPKFKFWVKSKGFSFLPCTSLQGRPSEMSGYVIAIPNKVRQLLQLQMYSSEALLPLLHTCLL